ncbi:MAG TPA: JAB domain-containing protein [Phycisphaerae bacterium]|nr:JAB domain-containing protein [Phycisphaerae bacterium]HRY70896.1 JAB domain-containing protein [Phycisphaerae bacterium]HSA29410.1 JAB domain-containing protein [Phycisphaerae bacterium]
MTNAYRLEVVRTRVREPQAAVNSSGETAARYAHLDRYDRERLVRLDLDSRNRVIGEEVVSIGTVNSAPMHPREVFKGAILSGAVRIIVLHNHPGGCPLPNAEDEEVNDKLKQAGEILGIPVIDFVIIGEDGGYWSSGSGEGQVKPAGTSQK